MPYKDLKKRKEYAKKHYEANKAVYKARADKYGKKKRAELRQWKAEYLEAHPCIDCGETDVRCLVFDHINGEKTAEISDLARASHSIKRIETEIAKCVVRCANCHMIRHSGL